MARPGDEVRYRLDGYRQLQADAERLVRYHRDLRAGVSHVGAATSRLLARADPPGEHARRTRETSRLRHALAAAERRLLRLLRAARLRRRRRR